MSLGPAIIQYVAVPETVQIRYDESKKWLWAVFRVPIEQLQEQAPTIYRRLEHEERGEAVVLVAHAEDGGTLPLATKQALEQFKPDVFYCCHPSEARKANPGLPIQGWHNRKIWFRWYDNSRIFQIFRD